MQNFEQWAIVELLGHTRFAGRVTEEELFGEKLGRCDIPDPEKPSGFRTEYFPGTSLYRLRVVGEEEVRELMGLSTPKALTYDESDSQDYEYDGAGWQDDLSPMTEAYEDLDAIEEEADGDELLPEAAEEFAESV